MEAPTGPVVYFIIIISINDGLKLLVMQASSPPFGPQPFLKPSVTGL
jgi:hypothetical protein